MGWRYAVNGTGSYLTNKQILGLTDSWINSNSNLFINNILIHPLSVATTQGYSGSNAVDIVRGDGHTLILTSNKKVYAFGRTDITALGFNTGDNAGQTPYPVDKDVDEKYKQDNAKIISAGASHSAIITTEGVVLTFGDGSNGKLGNGSSGSIAKPVRVNQTAGYDETNAKYVSCGDQHTFAIT